MDNRALNAGGFVVGGILIGLWVYFLIPGVSPLNDDVTTGAWAAWGLVGLALSLGMFFARRGGIMGQVAGWTALGVGVGLLIAATFIGQRMDALAALFTLLGGGLIANAWSTPSNELPARK